MHGLFDAIVVYVPDVWLLQFIAVFFDEEPHDTLLELIVHFKARR